MLTGLAVGDPDGHVGRAWIAAQDLRRIYRGAHDQADARRRLHKLLIHCAHSGVPELERLARTLHAWTEKLLAYWPTGRISNGPTEAINLLIKKVKRVGHGFRNFANYRLRVLLHAGIDWTTVTWQAPPATPTRGRHHAS